MGGAEWNSLTAGLHGYNAAHTKSVTVTLAPGPHALRLDYFQGAGNVGLTLLMSTTTAAAAQPISPSALSHSAVRNPKFLIASNVFLPFAHVLQMGDACPNAVQLPSALCGTAA